MRIDSLTPMKGSWLEKLWKSVKPKTLVVHTYAPTGRRTRHAKSRIWKPVYNHDLSGKSFPMDKDKRLMDYSPDFDRVEFRQIITARDTLEQLLSVRDMDEAVTKLFVSVRSLHV